MKCIELHSSFNVRLLNNCIFIFNLSTLMFHYFFVFNVNYLGKKSVQHSTQSLRPQIQNNTSNEFRRYAALIGFYEWKKCDPSPVSKSNFEKYSPIFIIISIHALCTLFTISIHFDRIAFEMNNVRE